MSPFHFPSVEIDAAQVSLFDSFSVAIDSVEMAIDQDASIEVIDHIHVRPNLAGFAGVNLNETCSFSVTGRDKYSVTGDDGISDADPIRRWPGMAPKFFACFCVDGVNRIGTEDRKRGVVSRFE